MKGVHLALALSLVVVVGSPSLATTFYGPSSYLQATDSPFHGLGFSYFHLEDFEEPCAATLNICVPGVSAGAGVNLGLPNPSNDSVDEDVDGVNGTGTAGHSVWRGGGVTAFMEFTFDDIALGDLPTHAGIVYTDSTPNASITFEAFDALGVSLGTVNAILGDGNFNGGTGEDRFFGVSHAGGISAIRLTDNGAPNNLEADHLQYGFVPEPGTALLTCVGLLGLGLHRRRLR